MHEMRSSVILVGALLGRVGKCKFTYPGGCEIGARPINMHLDGFEQLGVNEIITLLEENREQDKVLEYTSSGIHRDNILFVKNKKNFVHTASTGQRRLLALLLRIIQAKFYFSRTQRNPILLLDDVLLELDQEKRNKVMQLLPDYDQLFCTFLPTENYDKYKKSGTKVFFINQGECSEQ